MTAVEAAFDPSHNARSLLRTAGEANGVTIPNQAAEHYYLLTEPMEDVGREWPVVEDPSSCTYIRPEGGGLMVRA